MRDMKFKQGVNVQLLSRRTMRNLDDFLAMIRFHIEHLPELPIDKWQTFGPIRNWDENSLNTIHKIFHHSNDLEEYTIYGASSVDWRHAKKVKSEGAWETGCWIRILNTLIHGGERFTYEFSHLPCEVPVRYLKQAAVPLALDFAFIDTMTENYYHNYQIKQDDLLYGFGRKNWFSVATAQLIHCLPDMYWGVVFGKAYSDLFSMDKLLSAPAYHVEQLADDVVYIQLSETLGDVLSDFKGVQAVREQVKAHLGNAFFKPESAYRILPGSPFDDDPNYEPPEPGLVYDVPHFVLEKDRYVDWEDTWRGKEE